MSSSNFPDSESPPLVTTKEATPLEVADDLLVHSGRVARWMDKRFLDPILGLVAPGLGDAASAALGVTVIYRAWRANTPLNVLTKLAKNLLIDAGTGVVPVVGDIFDFTFRAHKRNHAMLTEYWETQRPQDSRLSKKQALLRAAAMVGMLLGAVALIVFGAWFMHAIFDYLRSAL